MPGVLARHVRNLSALAVLLGLGLCAAVAGAANDTVVYEGTFPVAELGWESLPGGGLRPVLAGTRHLALPGAPDLPVAELVLLVPLDRTVTGATIEPLATHRESLKGTLGVAGVAALDDGTAVPYGGDVDKAVAAWGELTGSHLWRGYRLVTVQVRPLRPLAGDPSQVEFLDAYAVRLSYGPAAADEDIVRRERFVAGEAERNASRLQALVANPAAIRGYAREQGLAVETTEKGFIPTPLPSLTGSTVPYVIITSIALAPEFQRLADHKTARGLATVVVTRESIAANYRNGADIQETLRMFIRDAYQRWGTEFVLLGGDSDVLPPRYVNNSLYPAGGSTDIPTELYFQCLDGNWNANGNGRFGEPGSVNVVSDDADFAEEIDIGRAPVSTPAAAADFVDKVITYETTPKGSDWAARVLFAAEVLFPAEWTRATASTWTARPTRSSRSTT